MGAECPSKGNEMPSKDKRYFGTSLWNSRHTEQLKPSDSWNRISTATEREACKRGWYTPYQLLPCKHHLSLTQQTNDCPMRSMNISTTKVLVRFFERMFCRWRPKFECSVDTTSSDFHDAVCHNLVVVSPSVSVSSNVIRF